MRNHVWREAALLCIPDAGLQVDEDDVLPTQPAIIQAAWELHPVGAYLPGPILAHTNQNQEMPDKGGNNELPGLLEKDFL